MRQFDFHKRKNAWRDANKNSNVTLDSVRSASCKLGCFCADLNAVGTKRDQKTFLLHSETTSDCHCQKIMFTWGRCNWIFLITVTFTVGGIHASRAGMFNFVRIIEEIKYPILEPPRYTFSFHLIKVFKKAQNRMLSVTPWEFLLSPFMVDKVM